MKFISFHLWFSNINSKWWHCTL